MPKEINITEDRKNRSKGLTGIKISKETLDRIDDLADTYGYMAADAYDDVIYNAVKMAHDDLKKIDVSKDGPGN